MSRMLPTSQRRSLILLTRTGRSSNMFENRTFDRGFFWITRFASHTAIYDSSVVISLICRHYQTSKEYEHLIEHIDATFMIGT